LSGTGADDRPLAGVRVLEVAMYVFGPAAGAALSDWGADVVKVEHPVKADPVRSTAAWGYPTSMQGLSYLWELSNRGKKGIAVDVSTPQGREIVLRLAERCDVFLTSLLAGSRRSLGIDVPDLQRRNPGIIYARASAAGPLGPEAEAGGFDGITYWARSGASASVTPEGSAALPMPGPGFGDIHSGLSLAGAVAAALYRRERTGRGAVVDVSLMANGLWAMQPSIAATSLSGCDALPRQLHEAAQNPLSNSYRTSDGRFVSIAFLQSDKYWPGFCDAVGHHDWTADPRFADAQTRGAHAQLMIGMLDELFAARPLAEWMTVLASQPGPWDVAWLPGEAGRLEQALANGYVETVEGAGRKPVKLVPVPSQFDGRHVTLDVAPVHGEHTDEVLGDLGISQDELDALRGSGVIA
jgi:crotonobetainyl-CoA:carnitine CoA-transferase CaiB-like acyl-CoA transferase